MERKIILYYQGLREEVHSLVQQISKDNVLETIEKLFLIDAKIQILFFFLDEKKQKFSEDEVISMAEIDSLSYYKEAYALTGPELSHSLLCLSLTHII